MAYFKINDVDYSSYVNELKVNKTVNFTAQVNAAGNTVVDYQNSKREIEVGIIPIDAEIMAKLQNAIDGFSVSVSFRNPQTNQLEAIKAIIPSSNVEYYTIQTKTVSYKAFTLTFIEL